MDFTQSRKLQPLAHRLIPGACHTYAKGDDQFPQLSPQFITHGQGSRIWDVDGNEYIEYGMGCRAVTLGHAYQPVVDAVQAELTRGANFSRPALLELECAEEFLGMVPFAEMVKFSKEGSSATSAAVKLARACTGRDKIAICSDQPFFSIHDWFIGTTAIDAGIPNVVKSLTVGFRYNDLDSVREMFKRHPQQIACVIMEPAKYEDPQDDFLHKVRDLCHQNGALFILDEMITGFRWHNGGGQTYYDIEPDLSTFGKGMGNGFAVSALAGKREYMQRGGLYHDDPRVFLLSTTHGAETHALAAAMEVMRTYQREPVVETLTIQGTKLADGVRQCIQRHGLSDYVQIVGRPCSLVFVARDPAGQPSQGYRTLLLQELIRNHVLCQSLVISYAHTDEDIAQTVAAFDAALTVYGKAIEDGYQQHLVGRPSQVVYRSQNSAGFSAAATPWSDDQLHAAARNGPASV